MLQSGNRGQCHRGKLTEEVLGQIQFLQRLQLLEDVAVEVTDPIPSQLDLPNLLQSLEGQTVDAADDIVAKIDNLQLPLGIE